MILPAILIIIRFALLVISTLILALFPVIPPKDKMSRMNGLIYVILYATYLEMLFLYKNKQIINFYPRTTHKNQRIFKS